MRGLVLAVLLTLAATAASAQERPPAIRTFDLATIEKLGRDIARQDAAAWVATDALRARVRDLEAAGLQGWVVTETSAGQRVRFLRDLGGGLEAGYDVEVAADLKTAFSEPSDRTLTAEERAKFAASRTAEAAVQGQPICRPGYNHVVLRDPEGDGWLVWLLAPTPDAGGIPLGGHYRVSVSADGRTVIRRDALSASCATMPKADASKGQPAALVVTHVVSPSPVETHVFLQLQNRHPFIVLAGERVWGIVDGRVSDRGPLKDLQKRSARPR